MCGGMEYLVSGASLWCILIPKRCWKKKMLESGGNQIKKKPYPRTCLL
jgi:hypothetical protein